jgi:hypothetical protein
MKVAWSLLFVLAAALFVVANVRADDKEVTLKGTITCAKCDLKEADKCHTVIKVSEDGKDVVYYFDDAGSKKYHKKICQEAKKGEVTGTVSEKDGKKVVKVEKVKYDE